MKKLASLLFAAFLSLMLPVAALADGAGVGSSVGSGALVGLTGASVSSGDVSFTAVSQSAVLDTNGYAALSLGSTGTWVGTVQVQWGNKASGTFTADLSGKATFDANGQRTYNTQGRYAKITTTAWTSGTAVVTPFLHTTRFPEVDSVAGASGKTAVTAAIASTTCSGAFRPIAGHGFNFSAWGTFVGTVELKRSFDGGTTKLPFVLAGTSLYSWTVPTTALIDEPEANVDYYACVTWTSGTVNVRISE